MHQAILNVLARRRGLEAKHIAAELGWSPEIINLGLSRLEALGRVRSRHALVPSDTVFWFLREDADA